MTYKVDEDLGVSQGATACTVSFCAHGMLVYSRYLATPRTGNKGDISALLALK